MADRNDFMRVAVFDTADGIGVTSIYWCRVTGELQVHTTSDGRYRAGGGPEVYKPTAHKAQEESNGK